MKKILKNQPQFFIDYLIKKKPNTWGELSKEVRHNVRIYMLSGMCPDDNTEIIPSEQNFQCAYTELNIEPESSHVDHFRKQSIFPSHKYIFNWSNLFTACNNEDFGAKFKDKKIKKVDYQCLINPALDDPNDYLTYNLLGEILEKASDKKSIQYKKAKTTIYLFNLNDYSLVQQRKTVSKQVQAMCDQLTLEEIKKEIGRFDNFVEFAYKTFNEMK